MSTVNDQLIKNQEYDSFYDLAVEYYAKKAIQANDVDYAIELFHYMEQAKGNAIFQSLRQAVALEAKVLPKTILDQKRKLKYDITNLQLQLKSEIGEKERLNCKIKFVELQKEYLSLLEDIESTYPDYYKIKYATLRKEMPEFQAQLEQNQLALNFYYGKYSVAILSMTKESFHVSVVPLENAELVCLDKVLGIQDLEAKNHMDKTRILETYQSNSSCVFDTLIKDHIAQTENIQRLVIIPHRKLNELSFESLCVNEISEDQKLSYKNLDYLIKKYAVSYLYAASFPQFQRTRDLQPYVGFAPTFAISNDESSTFYDLPTSRNKVKAIAERTGGNSFLGVQSTFANFQSESELYDIVHVSTHTEIDPSNNLNSKLWMAGASDGQLSPMTVEEIYQLNIPGSLVVLSACQTGKGELVKGEGPVHFSHAFSYAGARNVWMSLWSIPEHSTASIVSDGLQHVEDGLPVDLAIQKAKIKYIENAAERTAAPFYWAGMISIGSNDIMSDQYPNWIVYCLLLLTFITVLYFTKLKTI